METIVIPATQPYIARYKQAEGYYTDKPVIAWDDDGYPLVAGEHRLQRADSWTNYTDIVPSESPIVAVIPGGGWLAGYKDEDSGEEITDPVLAWTVTADGTCQPVDVDGTGWCDDPTSVDNFTRLYEPASSASTSTAA
jgi:hypothetical protein